MTLFEKWETYFKANGIYQELEKCEHGITRGDISGIEDPVVITVNPHHHESVLTHILMVRDETLKISDDPIAEAIALLHDISKAYVRKVNVEKENIRFHGRGYMSALMSVNFLKENFPDDVLLILKVLSLFDMMEASANIYDYENDETVIHYLKILFQANQKGRITTVEERDVNNVVGNWRETLAIRKKNPHKKGIKENLTVLIGIPGSGKTTYAQNHTGEFLSMEEFLLDYGVKRGVTGTFNEVRDELQENVLVFEKKFASLMKKRFKRHELEGDDYLVDSYSTTLSSRYSYNHSFKNVKYVMFWRDYSDCLSHSIAPDDKQLKEQMVKMTTTGFLYPKRLEYNSIEHVIV